MALMEKELWSQWNIPLWFIASVAKLWFYEILFFQVTILMVKDKKRRSFTLKDTMSIKIIFMHNRNYITWTRVKLPVLFVEFDMVYIFGSFFFSLLLSVRKRSRLAKIWSRFLQACILEDICGPLAEMLDKKNWNYSWHWKFSSSWTQPKERDVTKLLWPKDAKKSDTWPNSHPLLCKNTI